MAFVDAASSWSANANVFARWFLTGVRATGSWSVTAAMDSTASMTASAGLLLDADLDASNRAYLYGFPDGGHPVPFASAALTSDGWTWMAPSMDWVAAATITGTASLAADEFGVDQTAQFIETATASLLAVATL